ncbi:MAG: FAD-dependent oxidoreductase, partial [Gemmataceae bacterium]|nr:FAD-dependent oxidoreductase [Gemmataceae bacterium]
TAAMREVLARTSWDATAEAMAALIDRAAAVAVPRDPEPRHGTPPVIVAGAGPTGLSAAYHLGEDALLIEKEDRVGGWCKSLVDNGFTFDFAGHIMFSNDPYVHEMYAKLLGDNVHWQDREAWIWSKGVYTRYPFQGALHGLPPDVIKECIVGAIESRYGALKPAKKPPAPSSNGHSSNGKDSACKVGDVKDCCGDGVMESTAPLAKAASNGHASAPPENFEEFIYKVWGAGIAKHFAIPYNRKLWSVPLTEMETSWLGGRVPLPDLEEMIEGALRPVPKPMGPNARFGYPLRGGFQALMDGFKPLLRGPVRLGTRIVAVSGLKRTVTLDDGEELPYRQLISTMPLPVLVRMMGDEVPGEVRAAAAGLRYVSVRCVNLGVGREKLTEKHWIYYPEDTIFHRIFVQGNASPHCNPSGGFGLTCEITYHAQHKPLPCDGDELVQRCIDDCRRVGFFGADDPVWAANQVDMPHAYVVYDHARPRNVATIRAWLAEQDILLAGRYSEWEYYNSDHAFLAGKKAAEKARSLLAEEVRA